SVHTTFAWPTPTSGKSSGCCSSTHIAEFARLAGAFEGFERSIVRFERSFRERSHFFTAAANGGPSCLESSNCRSAERRRAGATGRNDPAECEEEPHVS